MNVFVSLHLWICSYIAHYECLRVSPSINLFVYLTLCIYLYILLYEFVYLPLRICLYICLYVCVCISASMYVCVYLIPFVLPCRLKWKDFLLMLLAGFLRAIVVTWRESRVACVRDVFSQGIYPHVTKVRLGSFKRCAFSVNLLSRDKSYTLIIYKLCFLVESIVLWWLLPVASQQRRIYSSFFLFVYSSILPIHRFPLCIDSLCT